MEQSVQPQIEKLAKALNKVQAQLVPAMKNKENPFFHSNYLDLMGVWESCRKLLTDNGFAVIQTPALFNDKFVLITTLLHESGQSVQSVYPIVPVKNDPQGLGSAITYARRYSLSSIVGVCAEDEDDDGEEAMFRQPVQSKQVTAQTLKGSKFISEPQAKRFYAISKTAGKTDEEMKEYLLACGIASSREIPRDQYDAVCEWAAGSKVASL